VQLHPAVEKRKGKFVPLPHSLTVSETMPVLSDRLFGERRNLLKNRQPPLHPELEALQGAIAQLGDSNLAAKELDRDIQSFLGWRCDRLVKQPAGEVHPDRDLEMLQLQVSEIDCDNSAAGQLQSDINVFLGWTGEAVTLKPDRDLDWIQQIAAVGNSSDGNEFEKLVRKGLILLGFSNDNTNPQISLDPEATGGAGGLDFYCASPYPVVGECKATKTEKVPDGTAAQLIKLGYKHLQERYDDCVVRFV